jgi:hypothetical protein
MFIGQDNGWQQNEKLFLFLTLSGEDGHRMEKWSRGRTPGRQPAITGITVAVNPGS